MQQVVVSHQRAERKQHGGGGLKPVTAVSSSSVFRNEPKEHAVEDYEHRPNISFQFV